MKKAFDIGVESLSGASGSKRSGRSKSFQRFFWRAFTKQCRLVLLAETANLKEKDAGTFFLETFGCQMNDHDSEKVAGCCSRAGTGRWRHGSSAHDFVITPAAFARSGAKVFSRWASIASAARARSSACWVAWRSRKADIFKRAPWVSLVCGSASYRKLPEMLAELEAGNKRVTGLDNDTTRR